MVIWSWINYLQLQLLAADEGPLLRRLDPERRAAVLAALIGLVVLGVACVFFIWLGGHFVRREANRRPPKRPPLPSDWDRKQPAHSNEPPPDDEHS